MSFVDDSKRMIHLFMSLYRRKIWKKVHRIVPYKSINCNTLVSMFAPVLKPPLEVDLRSLPYRSGCLAYSIQTITDQVNLEPVGWFGYLLARNSRIMMALWTGIAIASSVFNTESNRSTSKKHQFKTVFDSRNIDVWRLKLEGNRKFCFQNESFCSHTSSVYGLFLVIRFQEQCYYWVAGLVLISVCLMCTCNNRFFESM